jgi:transcription elongation GreA/GreB family factor
VDIVSIGTVAHTTDLDSNNTENFTVLGAWDSEPEKGVVSYLSPIAQSILNRKVGEEVEFEVHGVKHRHRIESIVPFKTAEALA